MYKFKHSQTPCIFNNVFEKPDHKYTTHFSEINYKQKKFSLTSSKYSLSFRGPEIWNEFLTKEEKGIQSHSVFSGKIKTKLLESENDILLLLNILLLLKLNLDFF